MGCEERLLRSSASDGGVYLLAAEACVLESWFPRLCISYIFCLDCYLSMRLVGTCGCWLEREEEIRGRTI